MAKVFAVFVSDVDGYPYLEGVFSSLSAARAFVEATENTEAEIQTFTLDKPYGRVS